MANTIDIQNQAQAFQFAIDLNKAFHHGGNIKVEVTPIADSPVLHVTIGNNVYVINSDQDTDQIRTAINTGAFQHLTQLNQSNTLVGFLYSALHSCDVNTERASNVFHQLLLQAGYQPNVSISDVEVTNAPNWVNLLMDRINERIGAPASKTIQRYTISTEGSGPGFDINVVVPSGGSLEGAANAFTALVFPDVMSQGEVFRAVQDQVARLFLGYGEVGGGNIGVTFRNGGAKTGVFQSISEGSITPPKPRVPAEIQPGETINVNLNRREFDNYNFKPDTIFAYVPEREGNKVTWNTFFGVMLPQGRISKEVQDQYLAGIELKGKDGWSAKFKLFNGNIVADLFLNGRPTQYVNQKDVNNNFTGITYQIPFVQISGSEQLLETL